MRPDVVRPSGREADQLREIRLTRDYTRHAEGSVLVEFGDTKQIFSNPKNSQTEAYISGRIG